MSTATSYQPTIETDCGVVTFSHPAFVGGFGEPNGYILYIDGEPQPYTPGEVVVVDDDGGPWSVTLKATYEDQTFQHQLGQSKGNSEICPVETEEPVVTEDPEETTPVLTPDPTHPGEVEPVETEESVPTQTVDEIVTVETIGTAPYIPAEIDEAQLAPTGGDPVPAVLLAAAILTSVGIVGLGAAFIRKKRP